MALLPSDLKASAASEACHQPSDSVPDPETGDRHRPGYHQSKTIPTAIEFMQREVIEDAEEYLGKAFPDKQSDAYLLLKFDGNSTEEIERKPI